MIHKCVSSILILLLLFLCYAGTRTDEADNTTLNPFDSVSDTETPSDLRKELGKDSKKWMEHTVNALITDNPGALKPLFSPNLQETELFDSQLQSVFSFIDGEIESYEIVLGAIYLSTHSGTMESEVGCDIKTTTASYRLAISIRMVDKADSRKEGIQSLYVININDIPTDVGYWGSVVLPPGITVARSEGQ